MAREIVTRTWCDQHLDRDERVEGEPITLAVNGAPLTVDLCDGCVGDIVAPVSELLSLFGRTPDKAAVKAPKPVKTTAAPAAKPLRRIGQKANACPLCHASVPGARTNLNGHMMRHHDVPLARWETDHDRTIDGKPLPYPCPQCDLRFMNATGRGAHVSAVHKAA